MGVIDRVAGVVARRSKLVVALVLVLTLAVGAGAGMVEQSSATNTLATDSTALEKDRYVDANFSVRGENTTTMLLAVRDRDGNVLSKDALVRSLRLQRDLRGNGTVNATLVAERPTLGVANLVARAAIADRRGGESPASASRRGSGSTASADGRESGSTAATDRPRAPSLDRQLRTLESMNETAVERTVARLLAPDSDLPGARVATRLLPRDYEPGSTATNATLVVLTQRTEKPLRSGAAVSPAVMDGQVAARGVAAGQPGPETTLAFGRGLLTQQQDQAIDESLTILGPLALAFVLLALSVAYRDPLDVVLGLVGVVLVLVWTFGAMGWAGVQFNQMMIAVPLLLVGLSVDYALHVVMRYREERDESGADVRTAMSRSLAGVGTALVLVTLTTAVGFLANLTSAVPDVRTFGAVTAAGIAATLVVFGLFVPALKTELDSLFEGWGFDRSRAPFGTRGSLGRLLRGGSTLARRAPLAVLVVALALSAGTAYGAADVDGTYTPEAFVADDPPEWTEELPASMEPGEYYLADNREYVYSTFQSPDKQVQLLVEGNVTRPDTLDRVADAGTAAAAASTTFARDGESAAVATPLTAMRATADRNRSFNATFAAADADGDGVPDRNLREVYDAFSAAAPDLAGQFLHRVDGEYAAVRLRVPVVGTADHGLIATQMRDVAAGIEEGTGGDLTATATGQPVVATEIADGLVETVVDSLAVTVVVVLGLLALFFRFSEGSATLGVVTVVPVLCSVSWLVWTMTALSIPFTLVTALVGSIALGLGVDYAIHVSERFADELEAGRSPGRALERTVTGTGGALLSSAVTTAAGFGVLAFSLLPALAQFGFVLAVGIGYAFVASVFVLPSLLALWAEYGPVATAADTGATAAASDD